MNTKLISILTSIAFGILPGYSFDFFGVPIGGTIDEMSDKLEQKGYQVVYITPTTGPNAGRSIILGNDRFRALNKEEEGETLAVTIFKDGDEVNALTLECKSARSEIRMSKYYKRLFNSLLDAYGKPFLHFVKNKATADEIKIVRNIIGEDPLPDIAVFWECEDGIIESLVDMDEYSSSVRFQKQ